MRISCSYMMPTPMLSLVTAVRWGSRWYDVAPPWLHIASAVAM